MPGVTSGRLFALLGVMWTAAQALSTVSLGTVSRGGNPIVASNWYGFDFVAEETVTVTISIADDAVDLESITVTNVAVAPVEERTVSNVLCGVNAYTLSGTTPCAEATLTFTFTVNAPGIYKATVLGASGACTGDCLAATTVVQAGFVVPVATVRDSAAAAVTGWLDPAGDYSVRLVPPSGVTAFTSANADVEANDAVFTNNADGTSGDGMTALYPSGAVGVHEDPDKRFVDFAMQTATLTPGLYKLNLAAGKLSIEVNSVTIKNAPVTGVVTVQVGFVPTVTLSADLNNLWVTTTNAMSVTFGHTAAIDLAGSITSPAAPSAVFTAGAALDAAVDDAPLGPLYARTLTTPSGGFTLAANAAPGLYALDLKSGVFCTSSGVTVCNSAVASAVTIKVGFLPTITITGSFDTQWVTTTTSMKVGFSHTPAILAGTDLNTPAELFESSASLTAATATSGPLAGATLTNNEFTLVANANPGLYLLSLQQGVFCYEANSVPICNARVANGVRIQVGFLPTITIAGSFDTQWVTTTASMTFTFTKTPLTPASSAAAGKSTPGDFFATGDSLTRAIAAASSPAAAGPLNGRTVSDVTFTLVANAEPGLYVLSLLQGVLCYTDATLGSVCNAPATDLVRIQVGYLPVTTPMVQPDPAVGDFRLVLAGGSTSALDANGMIDGTPVSSAARNAIRVTPPTSKTFHTSTVLTAGVFTDGSIGTAADVLGASPATGTRESDGSAVSFATQATVASGAYRLKLAAGKLAVQWTGDAANVVFNAEVNDVITVRVGFTPTVSMTSAGTTVSVASGTTDWLAAAAANVLTLTQTGVTLSTGATAAAGDFFAAGSITTDFSSGPVAGLFPGTVTGTVSGTTAAFTLPTTASPGRYNLNVKAGALKYTSNTLEVFNLVVANAAVVQIGFVPGVALRLGNSTVTGWLDGTEDYVLRLTPPSGSTAFNSADADVEAGDNTFVDGTTTGVSTTPKTVLFGSTTPGQGTHDSASKAFIDFPFKTATIVPGVYKLTLAAGKASILLNSITVRNAPVTDFITVQIGFMPDFGLFHTIPGASETDITTGTTWVNPAHSVRVRVTITGQTVTFSGGRLPAEYFDAGTTGGTASPVAGALGDVAGAPIGAYVQWSLLTTAAPGIYKLSLKPGVMSYGSNPTLFNAPKVDAFIVSVGFVPTFSVLKVSDSTAAEDGTNNNMIDGTVAVKVRVTAPATVGNIATDSGTSDLTAAGWVDGTIASSKTVLNPATGTASTNTVDYALQGTSNVIATGAYRLNLVAGTLQAATTADANVIVKNARVVDAVGNGGTIRVGFTPTFIFAESGTAVVATRWITTSSSFTVDVEKPSGVTALVVAGTNTAATFFSDATGADFSTGATASGGPLNGRTASVVAVGETGAGNVRFSLAATATPGKYRIALTKGVAKYAVSGVDIFNLAVTPAVTIQVGFVLTTSSFTLTQGGSTVTGWIRPLIATKIVVARPSISSQVRNYAAATIAVGNTGVLTDGSMSGSVQGFFGAAPPAPAPTAGTTTGEVEFTSPATLPAGLYKMNLTNGVLEVAVGTVAIRNVELLDAVTVQVGFTPTLDVQQTAASVAGVTAGVGAQTTGWLDGAVTGGISILLTPPATRAFSNTGTVASSGLWTSSNLASSLGTSSTGTVAAAGASVTFNIPTTVNPGVYALTLNAGVLKYTVDGYDVFNAPLTNAITVNVGYKLLAANFAVLQASSPVTGWIDGTVATSVRVTPLASQSFAAATPAGNTVWSAASGTTLSDVVIATAGTVIAASATFPLKATLDPATYVINLDAGKICTTATPAICNAPVASAVTITVGFNFVAADIVVQQQPAGGSFATVAQTNWLDGSLATQVVINRPTTIAASVYVEPTTANKDTTAVWAANSATSTAMSVLFPTVAAGTFDGTAKSLTFTVATSPSAGVYQLDIQQGIFCYTVSSKPNVCNAPFRPAATLRVGFPAALALVTGATQASPDGTAINTATEWLLKTRTDTIMRVRMTFATATVANAVQAQTVPAFSAVSGSTTGFAAGGTAGQKATSTAGTAPTIAVTFLYSLDLTALTAPSDQNFLALTQGVICNGGTAGSVSELCNAPTTAASRVQVKIGFVPTLAWNYVSGKAQNGATDVGTGAVSSSTVHDAVTANLVLKLTITPPSGVLLATNANAAASMVTTTRTAGQDTDGITIALPAATTYEYTVTFAAAASAGTYRLNVACGSLANDANLMAVTSLTTGFCAQASAQTVNIAAVPTFTFTYGARAFGQTGTAITAGSTFALDSTGTPADPIVIHDVGGTTGTDFGMTNVALQVRLAVKAPAGQQLEQPATISASAVRVFNSAGTDVSVQAIGSVVAGTTTFVSKEYLNAAGVAQSTAQAVDANGYLFTINVRNNMPPGLYSIRVDCSVLRDTTLLGIGTVNCPGTTTATYPLVRIGHRVTPSLVYRSVAYDMDEATAATIASGTAFNTARWHDTTRGDLQVAVVFAAQLSPAVTLKAAASQDKDTVTFTSSRTAGTTWDLEDSFPQGVTMSRALAGGNYEVVFTFAANTRPTVFTVSLACAKVVDAQDNPAVSTPAACGQTYTIRIGTVPLAPTVTYVSGLNTLGAAVTANNVVPTTMWHDTSVAGDTSLVVKLTIPVAAEHAIGACCSGASGQPARSAIVIAANTAVSTDDIVKGITYTSTVAGDGSKLDLQITFAKRDASSGGADPRRYFLNLDCSAIKDDLGNALGKRACINAVAALQVAIGYRVTKALQYAAAGADTVAVANNAVSQTTWHNAVNSPLQVRVTLTPTDPGINLATTGLAGGSASSNPVTREQARNTGGQTALDSLDFLNPPGPYLSATVASNTYTYPLVFSVGTNYAWSQAYTLKYLCQYVLDTNGAQAVQKGCDDTPDTVRIGFKPYWTISFTNNTLCTINSADCVIKPTSLTVDTLDSTSTWISREQADVVLTLVSDARLANARGAGFTAFSYAQGSEAPAFTVDAVSTATTLFTGTDHGLGGAGDTAAAITTLPAASAAIATPFSTLTYTLADIKTLRPGRYLFKMREGVLTSATANGASGKSIATTFILQIGYDFDFRVFRDTAGTVDTLPKWQDPCVTAPAAGNDCDGVMRFTVQARQLTSGFAVALDATERAAVTSRTGAASAVLFYAARSGSNTRGDLAGPSQLPNSPTANTATAIEFSLATGRTTTRPDTYDFQVKPGMVLAAVTPEGGTAKVARNAATYVGKLLVGFKPVVQVWYVPSSTSVATYDTATAPQYDMTNNWLDPSRQLQIRLITPTTVPFPPSVTSYDYATVAAASDVTNYGVPASVFENLDDNTGADCTVTGEVCKVGTLQGTTGAGLVGLFLVDAPVHTIGTSTGTGCTAALCPLNSARYNLRVSATTRAGLYTVNTMNGQLQLTSTGARNYESSFEVRIGWKPSVVFFHPGFDGVECSSAAADCNRDTSNGSPDDFRDTWFSNKLSGLKFRVGIDQTSGVVQLGATVADTALATLAATVPAGSSVTRQCPNTILNNALRNRLPVYCLNAGYSAAAFSFAATGTYVTNGVDVALKARYYTYDVTSTGPAGTLPAGQYALDIPDGVFVSGSAATPASNFAVSHKLKIGFTTTLTLNDAPTVLGTDISTEWVDKDRTDMSVLLQVFPPNTAPAALVPNVAALTAADALQANAGAPANLPAWGSTSYGTTSITSGTFVATVGADYTTNTPVYGPPTVELESTTAVAQRTARPYLAGTLAPVSGVLGTAWRVFYPVNLEAVAANAVPLVIALKLRPGVFCTSADANTDSQVCTAHTVDGAWAPSTAMHLPIRIGFVPRIELQLASDASCDDTKLHRGQWDPDYRGYRRIPDGTADTAAWGAWSWSGTVSSADRARPMVSFARRLCIALTHAAMTSNGASAWDSLFVTRRVPGLLMPEAGQSFEPAPAGMFQRPGGSYGTASLTFILSPDAATIAAATKLAGIEAGTYDLSLIQGTISGTATGGRPGFNARARITVRLGPQLTFYSPDGDDPLVTRGSAGFTNLRAVRLKIEGTEDDSFEFKQMVRTVNRTSPGWVFGQGEPATLLMTGLVNPPVQKNVPTEDRYLFIDYLLGITNLPDALYVMDVILQRGATAEQDKPLDLFNQKMWDVTTTFLQVDRTPPLVTPRVYSPPSPADFIYIGEKYTVVTGGCTAVAGAGVPLDPQLFVDAVSDAATVEIIDITSADNHNLVLMRGDTLADTVCVGLAGARPVPPCSLANAVFRTPGGSCNSLGVRGPVGNAEFLITARDSAGNVNTTRFTIPVRDKAQPVLTVIDKRGKSSIGTMYVGSAKTRGVGADNINADIRLSVSALYGLPVTGMQSSSLRCESSTNTVGTPVLADCTAAMSVSGYTSGLGNTSYSWTVTLSAATMAGNSDASRTALHGMTYRLYIDPFNPSDLTGPTLIKTSTGGLDTAPSNDVRVVIDNVAPIFQGVTAGSPPVVTTPVFSAVTGVVGGFYNVPVLGAFVDAAAGSPALGKGSSIDNIQITVTGTSSALQNGLTLRAGLQGSPSGVSGTPRSAPATGDTRWSVIAEDEAGHTATGVYAVRLTTVPPDFRLVFTTVDLRWTELVGGVATSIAVEPAASWRFRDSTGAQLPLRILKAFLVGAQPNAGGREEVITQTCPGGGTAVGNGGTTLKGTEVSCEQTTTGFPEGAVVAWLQGLRYSSTHTDVTRGPRTIRVELYAPVEGSAVPAQIATAQRVLVPVLVNDPPVLTLTPAGTDPVPAVTWDEVVHGETITSGQGGRTVFNTIAPFTPVPAAGAPPANTKLPALSLADADDANMRSATVRIAREGGAAAGSAPAFAACDVTRDRLRLPSGYSPTPSVVGVYDVSSCTLVLRPLAQGALSVASADMEAALRAVEYFNMDVHNPLGYGVDLTVTPAAATRRLIFTVEDDGNANKIPGGALSSAPVSVFLTITPVDDAPVMDRAALFGPGGLLEGTLPFANLATVTYGGDPYRSRKFTVVLPPVQDLPTVAAAAPRPQVVLRIPFDLGPVKLSDAPAGWSRGSYTALDADGVLQTYANGLFAKGAILDLDTQRPVSVNSDVNIYYRNERTGAQTWTAVNSAQVLPAGDGTMVWSYNGATYQGLLTVSVDDDLSQEDNPTELDLGQYSFRIVFGSAAAPNPEEERANSERFYIDIRRQACTLSTAVNFLCKSRVAEQCSTAPQFDQRLTLRVCIDNADPAVVCRPTDSVYYPGNEYCVFAPVTIPARSDVPAVISGGDADGRRAAMQQKLAALAAENLSEERRIAALAEERAQARGNFQLSVPPAAFSDAGSVTVSAQTPPVQLREQLTENPIIGAGADTARVDTSVAVQMGPAGTRFERPVKVCIFAGDTDAGTFKTLSVSSQVDPTSPGSPFTPWQPLQDPTNDEATGEACGFTTHFSVFAPVVRNLPPQPLVPKIFLQGGSCPLNCNGRGICDASSATCRCFAGFTGLDCTERACPVDLSWGEDQLYTHGPSECSGRGACDRSSGTCECFDGFEGAACERQSCPNDCSGHGVCRLLSELPGVQSRALEPGRSLPYAEWDLHRVQSCVCDGGYTGPDCSDRVCPFGDDVETNCDNNPGSMTVELTLSFGSKSGLNVDPLTGLSLDQFGAYAAIEGVSTRPLGKAMFGAGTTSWQGIPQQYSKNEGIGAGDYDLDGLLPVREEDDGIALVAHGVDGGVYITPTVKGVWRLPSAGQASDVTAALEGALKSLPQYWVQSVSASVLAPRSAAPDTAVYSFTFPYAETYLDPTKPLSCFFNNAGALGCPAAGCRPKSPQLRSLVTEPPMLPNIVQVNSSAILLQPAPMTPGDENLQGVWAVQTTLVLRRSVSTAPGEGVRMTYAWEQTAVYGVPATNLATATGREANAYTTETPLPPEGVRAYTPVQGPFGLHVDIEPSDGVLDAFLTQGSGTGPWSYTFKWSLPSCTVRVTSPLPASLEKIECGGRGACDRGTGECSCFEGYEGQACDTKVEIL